MVVLDEVQTKVSTRSAAPTITMCGFDRANGLVSGLRYPDRSPFGSF